MIAPFADHRLPRGRHSLDPELVAENQRWRLLGAGAAVFTERGYLATTSRLVAKRAAVSSATFYKCFEGIPALLRACVEVAAESVLAVIAGACLGSPGDEDLEPTVAALTRFAVSEPELISLLDFEFAVADTTVADRRQNLLRQMAELFGAADKAGSERPTTPHLLELALAAALALLLAQTGGAQTGTASNLPAELAELLGATAPI